MVQNRVYAPTQKEDDAAEKLRTILLRTDKLNEKIRDVSLLCLICVNSEVFSST